jgi:DNA polymerase-3 subunit beta
MKTIILKDKLKEGISVVERISSRILSLPILNNILITAEKSFLKITATDLEIGINWWALAKIEKEGKIAVPAKVLSGFIGLLPNKQVELSVKDLNLKIECENYETSVKGVNSEDFPIIPKISTEESASVKTKVFCQNLSQVVDIANYSSTKPEISGIYFLFQRDCITMAATDSFRLGEKKIHLSSPLNISKEYSFILPQRTAKEIINIFNEKEGNLMICFGANQIMFETPLSEVDHPHIQLVSRLIEGEYPNYQEIIPKKYETKVIIPSAEFINQIKLASLFSGKISEIKLKVDPKKNQIDLFSQSSEIGEHHSFLTGKVEGKPCEASFNYRFLIDGLLNAAVSKGKESEVVLELTGSEKPGIIRQQGDDTYLYLVMPIKAN